jgi:hypothetical protein
MAGITACIMSLSRWQKLMANSTGKVVVAILWAVVSVMAGGAYLSAAF